MCRECIGAGRRRDDENRDGPGMWLGRAAQAARLGFYLEQWFDGQS